MTQPREIQFPGWWESTFTRDENAVKSFESGSTLVMGRYAELRDTFAGHSIAEVAEQWYDDARSGLTRLIDTVVRVVQDRTDDARRSIPRAERAKAAYDRAEKAKTANRNSELSAELEQEAAAARSGYDHLVRDYDSAVGDVQRLEGLTTELYELLTALDDARARYVPVPAGPASADPDREAPGTESIQLAEGEVGRVTDPGEITFTPVSSCLTVVVTTTTPTGATIRTGAHLSLMPTADGYASDEILDAFVKKFNPDETYIDCELEGDLGSWSEAYLEKPLWNRDGTANYSAEEIEKLPAGDIRGMFLFRLNDVCKMDF